MTDILTFDSKFFKSKLNYYFKEAIKNEDAANEYKIKLCWLFSSYKQCIKLYSNPLLGCDNLKTRNKFQNSCLLTITTLPILKK